MKKVDTSSYIKSLPQVIDLITNGNPATDWINSTLDQVSTLGDDVTLPIEDILNIADWPEDEREELRVSLLSRFELKSEAEIDYQEIDVCTEILEYVWSYCRNRALEGQQAISSLIQIFEELDFPRPFLVPAGGYMLFYVETGRADFYHDNTIFVLEEGQIALFNENIQFRLGDKVECSLFVTTFFPKNEWRELLPTNKNTFQGYTVNNFLLRHQILDTFRSIIEISHTSLSRKRDLHINMLEKLLLLFSEIIFLEPEKTIDPRLATACRFIESHYKEKLTVEQIAKASATSSSTLTTLFRDQLDSSIMKWRDLTRIRIAKKMLIETDLPMKTIASDIGYDDNLFFSRRFKKITGSSPSQYRNRHKL